MRRVKWKAYYFLNPTKSDKTETFGFPTTKSPPPIKELDEFEEKMSKLIQNEGRQSVLKSEGDRLENEEVRGYMLP